MQRNRFVDVLKGLLIIFVIVLHSDIPHSMRNVLGFPFWMNMAVPIFMMISGYVSALSLQKKGSVEQAYEPRHLGQKMLRFVCPFTIAFLAQWIVFRATGLYQVGMKEYGLFALLLDYLRGGKGQGSYYFPIMIQFVFLFPAIYYFIKKYDWKGLLGCFGANGIFEVIKLAYGMEEYEYRLVIFRYLFLIAAGCYIAIGDLDKLSKKGATIWSVGCVAIGLGFTFLFSYTTYSPKILVYWTDTSFVACLFLVPVIGWLLKKASFGFKPLELVGKASFNIFLVQMIYYNFADAMTVLIPDMALRLGFGILNCVAAGVVFYLIEEKLTKALIRILQK